MTTRIYLTEAYSEIKNPFDLKRGCTSFDDIDLPVLQEFETWESGLKVLNSKKSSVSKNSGAAGVFFSVHEYWLIKEEFETDEDGDAVGTIDINAEACPFANFDVDNDDMQTLATFDSYAEANAYIEDHEDFDNGEHVVIA